MSPMRLAAVATRRARRRVAAWAWLTALVGAACAGPTGPTGPARYRLGDGDAGAVGHETADDAVLDDLRPRYPVLLHQVFEPADHGRLELRAVKRDLEHVPVDRRNFDALNAVAIAYFELDRRAEANPGGPGYFDDSFRAAKLLAVPWRAYGEVADPALRDAIIDFFEDAASGERRHTAATAARLGPIMASLEEKEDDPGRRARLRALAESLGGAQP
jgi:hypothetical protein